MAQQPNDGYFEVVWPRAARAAKRKALAPRLASLEGRKIAQLWDFLFRGDEVFALLEEGLAQRYPDIRFVSWREIGNTHASDERAVLAALPGRLRAMGVDAVVSGMGC
ncbi:MAG: hypothetical protein IT529_20880 [Burkholderiales bacterium]|nr:hypothetical protein [Burkholderiales bacterium]